MRPHYWDKLLSLYDTPDPADPEAVLKGYDRDHAARTASIALKVAQHLEFPEKLLEDFEITCLLHDLGRIGLDKDSFGRIFTLANKEGVATRPREFREQFPNVQPGMETDAFIQIMGQAFSREGITVNDSVRDQIEMRLGYKRRVGRMIERYRQQLRSWGIALKPWMVKVILYYYYPEELEGTSEEVRGLARILVASEQFEARNNRERGRDYYGRERESLRETFAYMDTLKAQGLISEREIGALAQLTWEGKLDDVLLEARELPPNATLPADDLAFIQDLKHAGLR